MLVDNYNRTIDYLRISVTDRCDLRCNYCIPKSYNTFESYHDWLTFEEIERVTAAFARLGAKRFRLTGGEPLLRKDFLSLVKKLSVLKGVEDLSVTTNGTQLERYAKELKKAGVHRLNVSLDTLRRGCFRDITGNDRLSQVLSGLQTARNVGFKTIKINMVLHDQNCSDIEQMIEFCMQNGFVLRLIELMPVGIAAQSMTSLTFEPLLADLQEKFSLTPVTDILGGGPARYWTAQNNSFTLGFITPLSRHFCETCNRVRLSVTGNLYMCLGQNYTFNLRHLLRRSCTDQSLEEAIRYAVCLKPEKHNFLEKPDQIFRTMALTGG